MMKDLLKGIILVNIALAGFFVMFLIKNYLKNKIYNSIQRVHKVQGTSNYDKYFFIEIGCIL